jgi:hypothetical protein
MTIERGPGGKFLPGQGAPWKDPEQIRAASLRGVERRREIAAKRVNILAMLGYSKISDAPDDERGMIESAARAKSDLAPAARRLAKFLDRKRRAREAAYAAGGGLVMLLERLPAAALERMQQIVAEAIAAEAATNERPAVE